MVNMVLSYNSIRSQIYYQYYLIPPPPPCSMGKQIYDQNNFMYQQLWFSNIWSLLFYTTTASDIMYMINLFYLTEASVLKYMISLIVPCSCIRIQIYGQHKFASETAWILKQMINTMLHCSISDSHIYAQYNINLQ